MPSTLCYVVSLILLAVASIILVVYINELYEGTKIASTSRNISMVLNFVLPMLLGIYGYIQERKEGC